jgi:hypothetical protein
MWSVLRIEYEKGLLKVGWMKGIGSDSACSRHCPGTRLEGLSKIIKLPIGIIRVTPEIITPILPQA